MNTDKNYNLNALIWTLLAFSSLYLFIAFPFSYFRHDDWLIIGNVVRLTPENWRFLFEPYLIFNSIKEIWFFRPWFKLLIYLNYILLGYHYYLWLCCNLAFTIGALIFGFLSLKKLTPNTEVRFLFVTLFVCSLHFHFGSLVWVGEGAMNCPQLFFLFLNFYFFSKAIREPFSQATKTFYFLAIISFVISLGFKESSIFHLPFLFLVLFHPENNPLTHRSKIVWFLPYAVLGALYLFFRLYFLPINPGYKPHINFQLVFVPFLLLLGSLLIPFFSLLIASFKNPFSFKNNSRVILSLGWYLVLFIPFFITYIGHGFFSPGWLLAPGMYLAFILALKFPLAFFDKKSIRNFLMLALILSAVVVYVQVYTLKWWRWHTPQKQLVSIIEELGSPQTRLVEVFDCQNPEDKSPALIRVVGYNVSIQEVFWLKHKTLPKVKIAPCSLMNQTMATPTTNTLYMKWVFPELTALPH